MWVGEHVGILCRLWRWLILADFGSFWPIEERHRRCCTAALTQAEIDKLRNDSHAMYDVDGKLRLLDQVDFASVLASGELVRVPIYIHIHTSHIGVHDAPVRLDAQVAKQASKLDGEVTEGHVWSAV